MRAKFTRTFFGLWATTLIAACGGNDPYTSGVYQAPNNVQYPTQGTFPTSPSYTFSPSTCPNGCAQNYGGTSPGYMFMPVVYWFYANPQYISYWQQLWSGWTQYAYSYGYNQYDFNGFWYNYAPQQWQGTQFQGLYNYLDQGFYSWAGPQTQYQSTANASYFWQYYSGYPYYGLNQVSTCAYSSCF